jgi:Na+-translocating ferredoxin:NAD+ oxidoreductase RnfG subunit
MDSKTLELIKNNLKDPSFYDPILKAEVRHARKTAIVLVSFLIIALIAVVYAFVQQTVAAQVLRDSLTQKSQLETCVHEAQKQQGLAAEAQMIAEEANRMALEQLKECQKKK